VTIRPVRTLTRALTRALIVALLVAGGSTALASSADAAAQPKISFSDVAFGAGSVDVSGGYAYVDVTWSVADTNPAATSLTGAISLQEFDGGTAVGPAQSVSFGLPGEWPAVGPDSGSTIATSHYTYQFLVPGFAASTSPVWRVTKMSASDDAGTTRRASGDLADLQVTGAEIDTTGPELNFTFDGNQRPIVFDDGTGVVLHFTAQIDDLETGFWKGRLVLTGPRDIRVTTPIELTAGLGGFLQCGHTPVDSVYDVVCDIDVPIPNGSPSGAWTPTAFTVTNNVGVSQRYTGFEPETVQVTRNDILSASGFALTPSQVNNWRDSQTLTLTMRAAGVHKGLSTVFVQSDICAADTFTPPIAADGTVSVPLTFPFFPIANTCTITGIALFDGAGHVAVYGSYYGAAPLNLVTTRIPDPTPPVALTAVVSPDTKVAGDSNHFVNVDITVADDGLAPIQQYSVTFYDANGASVGGGSGSINQPPPGGVVHLLATVNLIPGTYTAGFTLYDAADNFSQYGYPNQPDHPAPSGPLILTVLPAI
jgi:hypothetical protein